MLSPLTSEALAGVRHGFFGRQGGISTGLYSSLNCGLGSRDERAAVLENRGRVAAHLGVAGAPLLTCHQIHSANAIVIEAPFAPDQQPKADALVTRRTGLVLGALAADCAPILFADRRAGVIGAAHAGWKGALDGIVEATVQAMERAGARRADIVAAIGPCISQAAYEVGPEFRATFEAADPEHGRFFASKPGSARPWFDLPGFVAHRLATAGVGTIDATPACTYGTPELHFSYRRATHLGEADYGRQVSAIVLTG
jgi:hypothetical protein